MPPLPTPPTAVSLTALSEGVSADDLGLQPSDLDLIKAGQPSSRATPSRAALARLRLAPHSRDSVSRDLARLAYAPLSRDFVSRCSFSRRSRAATLAPLSTTSSTSASCSGAWTSSTLSRASSGATRKPPSPSSTVQSSTPLVATRATPLCASCTCARPSITATPRSATSTRARTALTCLPRPCHHRSLGDTSTLSAKAPRSRSHDTTLEGCVGAGHRTTCVRSRAGRGAQPPTGARALYAALPGRAHYMQPPTWARARTSLCSTTLTS